MSKKKNNKESNIMYVSRDKLCKYTMSLDSEDWSKCEAPHTEGNNYTVVYVESHLTSNGYKCGCQIFNNAYYPEFKFPELIWKDFFKEEISPGEKLIKFTIRKCSSKS